MLTVNVPSGNAPVRALDASSHTVKRLTVPAAPATASQRQVDPAAGLINQPHQRRLLALRRRNGGQLQRPPARLQTFRPENACSVKIVSLNLIPAPAFDQPINITLAAVHLGAQQLAGVTREEHGVKRLAARPQIFDHQGQRQLLPSHRHDAVAAVTADQRPAAG